MSLKEQTYSVLVVSSSASLNNALSALLPESRFTPVTAVTSISSAQRALLERDYDIIIVNSPLPDDPGIRFAIDTSSSKSSVILLLVYSELFEDTNFKVSRFGVFSISKPTSKPAIASALSWLISAREKLRRYEKKNTTIEEKMKEIRLVNRAKWILISELKMSEPDAHRYIEKQAMDQCVSKTQVAENIIKTYS